MNSALRPRWAINEVAPANSVLKLAFPYRVNRILHLASWSTVVAQQVWPQKPEGGLLLCQCLGVERLCYQNPEPSPEEVTTQ